MKHISIRLALKTGWHNFKRRPWYLFWLSAVILPTLLFISAQGTMFTAMMYILYGGYIAVLLKHFYGEHIVFDDLFSMDNRWISFAFLGVIKTILIIIGLFLFIVPGVYLSVRFMFADLLVMDQGMRPLEALRVSGEMTKGNMWKLFCFCCIAGFSILLSVLFFGIGSVLVATIMCFATIKLYQDSRI